MPAPSLAELLPPNPRLPWVKLQTRLERAREALAKIREFGYDVAVFPNGRDLYVLRRGKSPPPPHIVSLVNAHHNALVALIRLPEECEAVVGVIVPTAPRQAP